MKDKSILKNNLMILFGKNQIGPLFMYENITRNDNATLYKNNIKSIYEYLLQIN